MGTSSLAVAFVLNDRSRLRAGTGFHLLPSLHDPTYYYKTITHIVTQTSHAFSTQIQMHITHVTWSAQELRESKIDHTNAIYPPSAESESRELQWVGISDTFSYPEEIHSIAAETTDAMWSFLHYQYLPVCLFKQFETHSVTESHTFFVL